MAVRGLGMRAVGVVLAVMMVSASVSKAEQPSDAAPFGLRFGMTTEEVTFEKLKGQEDRAESGLWGFGGQTVILRSAFLTQCGIAFDDMVYAGLMNDAWAHLLWDRATPAENFSHDTVFTGDETSANEAEQKSNAFNRNLPIIVTSGDRLSGNVEGTKRVHSRSVATLTNFKGNEPLLDVIVEAPEDREVYLGHDTWREKVIADARGRQRRLIGYEAHSGGRKRRICGVFGSAGLMAVYVPQTELSDVWPDLVANYGKDNRYRMMRGEVADGAYAVSKDKSRRLVHVAWVDGERGLAAIAYVEGLRQRSWLDSDKRYEVAPQTTPYFMSVNLDRRSAAFEAFRRDARAALDAETAVRDQTAAAADAVRDAEIRRTKEAQDKMLGTFR